jgi:leucine-rich repeat protein SHOC2
MPPSSSRTLDVLHEWRAICPELQKLWPESRPVKKWAGLTFASTTSEHVLLKIHLPEQGLKVVPEALGEIKSLGYLNLRDNKLESVPASLGDFLWLTYLNLERNRLARIPPEMGVLNRLKTLRLSGNPWQFKHSLPEEWRWEGELRQNGGCEFRR